MRSQQQHSPTTISNERSPLLLPSNNNKQTFSSYSDPFELSSKQQHDDDGGLPDTSNSTIETFASYGYEQQDSTKTIFAGHRRDDENQLEDKQQQQLEPQHSTKKPFHAAINWIILLSIVGALLTKLAILIVHDAIQDQWHWHQVLWQVPRSLWNGYSDFLHRHELLCQALTSGTVYTVGDILAQSTEGKSIGQVERWRVLRSLVAGLCGHGLLSHVWYHASQYCFDNVLGWTAWWSVIPKVLVDQTVFGPIWNNTYIVMLGIMQWQAPSVIWQDMKRTTIPLIISGLKLWPAVHVITYGVIPVQNRLLWVDSVEIVWVIMLSTQAAKGRPVLDIDSEDMACLDEDDETIILHSQLIPEHFYGDRTEGLQFSNISREHNDLEHALDNECDNNSHPTIANVRLSLSRDDETETIPMISAYQQASSRRESLPAILQHRRESLSAGHPHSSHRRGSLLRTPVRGYYFGGQIWVL